MKLIRSFSILVLLLSLIPAAEAQAKRKRVLAIGRSQGFQHDAVSHGMATIWKLGLESGLWETFIRTDTELITKKKLDRNGKNLDYFDAVFFYTSGELEMDEQQKADLMSFIKEDGKGFAGAHSAIDTFYKWPEYGEMIGGYFDLHPWNQFQAPMVVEDPTHPIVKHFSPAFTVYDEIYQARDYSREKVRVLIAMDADKIDLTIKGVHRKDKDFAITWMRNYGKGRVFYSGLGHREEVWDRPDVQKMWVEGMKWALGLMPADATPRPKPGR